ncbi:McrC family protein [Vibrio cortegadensis]|uniref:McrC family protein n=1 Tax=Vibrio cortegadensis TaxID=1328770 RepID=UPI0021C39B1E|nr:McrC family protein [Vibrio cortegadensis]MDN3696112.1 McrC family protein [Vibrio cortegadensis]
MLKDCSQIDINQFAKTYFGGTAKNKIDQAINWLQRLGDYNLNNNDVLRYTNASREMEPIVYCDGKGTWWTGRYVGAIFFDGINLDIAPRFPFSFFIDNFPINNFIPIDTKKSIKQEKSMEGTVLELMLAIQWVNLLVNASKHALPVVQKKKTHIKSAIVGRLDVRATLKQRVVDGSKVVSTSFSKDINNPITQVIVLAYYEIQKWFPSHDVMHWMPEVTAARLQKMIDATPRRTKAPNHQEIKSAKLMPIAREYRSVARLSKDVLNRKNLSEHQSHSTNKTMLIDVAELWEAYVFNVLKQVTPENLNVKNGTSASQNYLLKSEEKTLGKLIPDYLILDRNKSQNDDDALIVADAKYKRIGDAPWMSPKRDDLYQMSAYLNNFTHANSGFLFYPKWDDDLSEIVKQNPWQFNNGKELSFIQLPIHLDDAITFLNKNAITPSTHTQN